MVQISCRALLIVFMPTSCSSHFGLCYSNPFDLWNAMSRLNIVDKRQAGRSKFCLCFLSKAAVGCYRRLSTEASALPNPKCANCAGAKSAKARFEFLPLAGAGIGFAGARAPNCVTCHSRRNEPDMSSSRIGSKTPSSPSVHPPVSSFSSYCVNVREDRTGRSEMNTTPPPSHPQSAEDIECTLHTHGSLNSRRMYPPPLSVLGSIGGALLRG